MKEVISIEQCVQLMKNDKCKFYVLNVEINIFSNSVGFVINQIKGGNLFYKIYK